MSMTEEEKKQEQKEEVQHEEKGNAPGASKKEGSDSTQPKNVKNDANGKGKDEKERPGASAPSTRGRGGRHGRHGQGRRQKRSAFGKSRKSRRGRGNDQPKSEFETKVLSARRVSRVVAGGRRFSLSVAVAVGNRKGRVGIGTGKGVDMAAAMDKARNQAQKRLVDIAITEEKGIPNEAEGKYCASVVHIRPSQGFVAGGAVRIVAELAGVEHINAKIQSRSKCHLNNARATLRAFEQVKK